MDIVTPGIGLIFWTGILFLTVLFILSKVAFKPIVQALKVREDGINSALEDAKAARQQVANLQAKIANMEQEARRKREDIIKEAKATATQIVQQAQDEAKNKQAQMITEALNSIEAEKQNAIKDIKNEVASLSLNIAEKILRKNLSDDLTQQSLINQYVQDYHNTNPF